MKKTFKLCALFVAITVFISMLTIVSADETKFIDVNESDYFYQAVQWGVEAGITNGAGDNQFDPEGEVTRSQVVTFLWRMAGKPEAEATETFSDVEEGSWYEDAVKWAVESGITLGTGEGKFSPEVICDRAMCITLLYRFMESPFDGIDFDTLIEVDENTSFEDYANYFVQGIVIGARDSGIFEDVAKGEYYELPVYWAVFNGIITEDNTLISEEEEKITFCPENPCVRKEMISFLYQTKLMQDAANEPEISGVGPVALPIPREYTDLLYKEYYAISDDDDFDEETMIIIGELASREAAEAMGIEDTDGIGELFRIVRVSEDKIHELLCGDMSGIEVFAKDTDGIYYLFCHPTDVRFMRETTEKMYEDAEQWAELNEWANTMVPSGIIECSKEFGLEAVSYSNTVLDMYLARIAYANDVKYTISTTEFGPLDPGSVDPKPYIEYLLKGNFEEIEDKEAPDGEYVVLNFPEEGVRFDFFDADKNLVREVHDDYEVLYERVLPAKTTNKEVMSNWYDELAEQAGKKELYHEVDQYFGSWVEEIAGRGTMTISKSYTPINVKIEASWPSSAFERDYWEINAFLAEDGSLTYDESTRTAVIYSEDGNEKTVAKYRNEGGLISLTKDGKIVWKYAIEDEENNEGTFVKMK